MILRKISEDEFRFIFLLFIFDSRKYEEPDIDFDVCKLEEWLKILYVYYKYKNVNNSSLKNKTKIRPHKN